MKLIWSGQHGGCKTSLFIPVLGVYSERVRNCKTYLSYQSWRLTGDTWSWKATVTQFMSFLGLPLIKGSWSLAFNLWSWGSEILRIETYPVFWSSFQLGSKSVKNCKTSLSSKVLEVGSESERDCKTTLFSKPEEWSGMSDHWKLQRNNLCLLGFWASVGGNLQLIWSGQTRLTWRIWGHAKHPCLLEYWKSAQSLRNFMTSLAFWVLAVSSENLRD